MSPNKSLVLMIAGFVSVPIFIVLQLAVISSVYDCVSDSVSYICTHLSAVQGFLVLFQIGMIAGLVAGVFGLVVYLKKTKH